MWLEVLEGHPLFLCATEKINIVVKYFYKEEAIKGQSCVLFVCLLFWKAPLAAKHVFSQHDNRWCGVLFLHPQVSKLVIMCTCHVYVCMSLSLRTISGQETHFWSYFITGRENINYRVLIHSCKCFEALFCKRTTIKQRTWMNGLIATLSFLIFLFH